MSLRRIRLLEHAGIIWNPHQLQEDRYIHAAKEYFREHVNLHIPASYITKEGLRLGGWLSDQRSLYKKGRLSDRKTTVLESMGVRWQVNSSTWEEMFALAEDYYNRNGSLSIPAHYKTQDGVRLGEWISNQREKHVGKGRNKPLTQEQVNRLEAIGMVWEPYRSRWLQKYLLAKNYFETNGHLNVPVGYITETGVKLGMWLSSQRQAMRGNPNFVMTEERKRLLDKIGMDWSLKFTRPGARQRPETDSTAIKD